MSERIVPRRAHSGRAPLQVERRAQKRYSCALNAHWRLLGCQGDFHPARVVNISGRGLGLVTDASSEVGTVMVLMMEPRIDRFTRLQPARVVHAHPLPSGEWHLGCTLVSKLNEEELVALVRADGPPDADGLTESIPFPSAADAPLPDEGDGPEMRSTRRQGGNPVPVLVCTALAAAGTVEGAVIDRSCGGLCLSVPRPFSEGSRLRVRAVKAPGHVAWVSVKVRHNRRVGSRWLLGCQFVSTPSWEELLQFG